VGFDDADKQDWGKYDGFRVHWDKDLRTFVFDSKDERDRWQIKQYGQVRNGFREPDDPDDGRPAIIYNVPPYKSREEQLRYERAASLCPVSASGSLTLDKYLGEIVLLASGLHPVGDAVKAMPR
jgi:hypothetical protein